MLNYNKFIGDFHGLQVGTSRTAIRGIILKDDQILLIRTSSGDLKFPGGGIQGNETYEEALRREIREETGYINIKIDKGKDFAKYVERKVDEQNPKQYLKVNHIINLFIY